MFKNNMHKLTKNMIGQRFGRLLVLEYAGINKHGCAQWKCLCNCGGRKVISGANLRRGDTKSCGCLHAEVGPQDGRRSKLPDGEGACRELYRKYGYGARDRKLTFEITLEEFKVLTKGNCYYCGVAPVQVFDQSGTKATPYIYNGIDRLDNTEGYILGNCVPCCFRCNHTKGTKSEQEFLSLIKCIYEHQRLDSWPLSKN